MSCTEIQKLSTISERQKYLRNPDCCGNVNGFLNLNILNELRQFRSRIRYMDLEELHISSNQNIRRGTAKVNIVPSTYSLVMRIVIGSSKLCMRIIDEGIKYMMSSRRKKMNARRSERNNVRVFVKRFYAYVVLVSVLWSCTSDYICDSNKLENNCSISTKSPLIFVRADWIDPDTPLEARTTLELNAKQYRPPKPKPTTPTTKTVTTSSITTTYRNTTTMEHPRQTSAPSSTPSASPTATPSMSPTIVPKVFDLVFSDEFNLPGRRFDDGRDTRWTALNKNDYTNDALHYYSPEVIRTDTTGHLVIRTDTKDTEIVGFDDVKRKKTHVTKHFRSGMMQSWNKFCFTGGIVEAQVTLPGKSEIGGLWPAFWLLGNLARHTYVGSSEHIWPWSSSQCTAKSKTAQKVSGCNEVAHYGMASHLGRGAPEIDIFEVQPGNIQANKGVFWKSSVGQPFMSASFQVAPGRSANRPGPGEWPGPDQWYSGTKFGANTSLNILFYGAYNHFLDDTNPIQQDYWSDAISYNRQLNQSFFETPHVYRLEWDVPVPNVSDGYLHWFLDGELVSSINGTGIIQAGLGSEISSEPSYILLNTAVSKQWGFPHTCPLNCPCDEYNCNSKDWSEFCGFSEGFCDMVKSKVHPIEYKIDYVRVYQDSTNPAQKVGCSTPERPTRKYVVAHEDQYKTENDEHPLKGIPNGLGDCDPTVVITDYDDTIDAVKYATLPNIPELLPKACGGPKRGKCTFGKVCECYTNWTGPNCMSHDGYDPVLYDVVEKISDVGFVLPHMIPTFLLYVLSCMVLFFFVVMWNRRRLQSWEPIPDVDVKKTYVQQHHLNATSMYNGYNNSQADQHQQQHKRVSSV